MAGMVGNDVVGFAAGFGNDVINGFEALNDAEDIDLSAVSAITDFNDLVNNYRNQVGARDLCDRSGHITGIKVDDRRDSRLCWRGCPCGAGTLYRYG